MVVLRLRAARDRKKRQEKNAGRPAKCEGRKGYKEAHPDVVAEIRRLRRKPKGKKRMTFAQVADQLNAGGYQSASGRPFSEGMVKVLMHRLNK